MKRDTGLQFNNYLETGVERENLSSRIKTSSKRHLANYREAKCLPHFFPSEGERGKL